MGMAGINAVVSAGLRAYMLLNANQWSRSFVGERLFKIKEQGKWK